MRVQHCASAGGDDSQANASALPAYHFRQPLRTPLILPASFYTISAQDAGPDEAQVNWQEESGVPDEGRLNFNR